MFLAHKNTNIDRFVLFANQAISAERVGVSNNRTVSQFRSIVIATTAEVGIIQKDEIPRQISRFGD